MENTLKPVPWHFTIVFDEDKAMRNGYDIQTLYDYTDRNVSRYGCVRIAQGAYRGQRGASGTGTHQPSVRESRRRGTRRRACHENNRIADSAEKIAILWAGKLREA